MVSTLNGRVRGPRPADELWDPDSDGRPKVYVTGTGIPTRDHFTAAEMVRHGLSKAKAAGWHDLDSRDVPRAERSLLLKAFSMIAKSDGGSLSKGDGRTLRKVFAEMGAPEQAVFHAKNAMREQLELERSASRPHPECHQEYIGA